MERNEENDIKKQVVQQLTVEVERKETDLKSLTSELEEIKASIYLLQQDRQDCIEKLFQSQEASPLVSENEHTRKELEEKRERLERLNHGEASERMEVDALERHLEDLQSGRVKKQLDNTHRESSLALKELKTEYEDKMQAFQSAQDALQTLNCAVARLKARQYSSCSAPSTSHKTKKRSMDEKLDKLVLKTCQRAGLELCNNN